MNKPTDPKNMPDIISPITAGCRILSNIYPKILANKSAKATENIMSNIVSINLLYSLQQLDDIGSHYKI